MNLNEEIIWDHKVSSQTKQLWSIEIDLAEKLLEVCKKHSLKIWVCYGTLLGAVRHKGFIPWDDDMDFVMFRDDYNRLLEVASSEFSHPYFFQSIYSDAFWGGMSRLRRSDTTMLEIGDEHHKKCNRGIWVDIFVLDGVPAISQDYQKLKSKVKFLRRIVTNSMTLDPKHLAFSTKVKHFLISTFCKIVKPKKMHKYIVRLLSANRISDCTKVAPIDMMSLWPSGIIQTKPFLEKAWFQETKMLPFHDILVPAPREYDILLGTLYGDYMKPVKGAAGHVVKILDCNKSYIEYVNE